LQIYGFPLNAEQVWFPKEPKEVSFVHPIHAGTSIIAGTRGQAIIIDIQKTLLVHTLHDGSDTTEIRSIAVRVLINNYFPSFLIEYQCYNDYNDQQCMVATASDQNFIVWKAQAIYNH
jgi:hypothetical protein